MMAITYDFVQGAAAASQADPAVVTLGATPTQGNLLIAIAAERSGGTGAAHTISGTGWTKRIAIEDTDATTRKSVAVWSKVAGASEATEITFDDGTTNAKNALVAEYEAGATVTWTFEDEAAAVSTAGTTNVSSLSSGSTASIAAGAQLLIGVGMNKTGNTEAAFVASWSSSNLANDAYAQGGIYGRTLAIASLQESASGAKATTLSHGIENSGMMTGILVFSAAEGGATSITKQAAAYYRMMRNR